jgi:hypothetical protein
MMFCAHFGKAKGKRKQFKSCGDLTIYPIREIKGNRIIYGDQFDVVESDSENCYFVKNADFLPDILDPDSDSEDDFCDDTLTDEPIYAEIDRRPVLKLSKSFEYIPNTNQSVILNNAAKKIKSDQFRNFLKVS